jgi:hypothetical protein
LGKKTKGKTLTAVLNEKSNFTLSTWPLNNRNSKIHKPLVIFKHKLLTGLPTRNKKKKKKWFIPIMAGATSCAT